MYLHLVDSLYCKLTSVNVTFHTNIYLSRTRRRKKGLLVKQTSRLVMSTFRFSCKISNERPEANAPSLWRNAREFISGNDWTGRSSVRTIPTNYVHVSVATRTKREYNKTTIISEVIFRNTFGGVLLIRYACWDIHQRRLMYRDCYTRVCASSRSVAYTCTPYVSYAGHICDIFVVRVTAGNCSL